LHQLVSQAIAYYNTESYHTSIDDVGKLVITDGEGNLVYTSGLYRGTRAKHFEPQGVADVISWLQQFADSGQDYQVHIITEYSPCEKCQPLLSTWTTQIENAAFSQGSYADFFVWWHRSARYGGMVQFVPPTP